MNDTKWNEIRNAMHILGTKKSTPIQWRTKDFNGHLSSWDAEWYYHFQQGGYASIEWLEIKTEELPFTNEIVNILKSIHVPGKVQQNSVIIYGYKDGFVDYI